MQSVSTEFPRPISEEFAYCWEQQNLGLSPEAAMRELARRTGLLELKIFVVAMMVHRSTGGNFSELLDKLAKVIRDRYRIRGQIQALTAEGRFQGIILLALAPTLMMILFFVNKAYILSLFQYPRCWWAWSASKSSAPSGCSGSLTSISKLHFGIILCPRKYSQRSASSRRSLRWFWSWTRSWLGGGTRLRTTGRRTGRIALRAGGAWS